MTKTKKQSPYLQDINRLREWYTLVLKKYHADQMRDWIERTKDTELQPKATFLKAKRYLHQFFSILYVLQLVNPFIA